MHALVKGAVGAALLSALGGLDRPPAPLRTEVAPREGSAIPGMIALCAPGTIPDGETCAPAPAAGSELSSAPFASARAAHRVGRERWETYDQIPRRPDRPAEPGRYRWPVGSPERPAKVLSGYDLDMPGVAQRQGPAFHATGHGGIDLSAGRGDPVAVVALDAQQGAAEVLFVGELFGTTVALGHTVREGNRLRQYVALYGHLEHAAVTPGAKLEAGDVLGAAGDSGSPGIVHLHFEIRQVRENVSLGDVARDPRRLVNAAVSVACDPRNVVPLL